MNGRGLIVVIVVAGLFAAAFVHFMHGEPTDAPAPAARAPAHIAVPAPTTTVTPSANVADVPPWLRPDAAAPAAATTAAAFVPTPVEQATAIVADRQRAPVFKAAGVDMDAIRNNQRISAEMRPLIDDLRKIAADTSNPGSRKALQEKLAQIRALQKGLVYDVRIGADR
jgi:hypothetical protein